ncbi:MAG: hypothetical protein Phog2KO_26320 [Phototrophicaceae bacterium]
MNHQNHLPSPSQSASYPHDWGEASISFDEIKAHLDKKKLQNYNEAETRLKILDQILTSVLGWNGGHIEKITPEEPLDGAESGYVDYMLRAGDYTIVLEAKSTGKKFPSPSNTRKRKLYGSSLYSGDTKEAIDQVITYGNNKRADIAIISNGDCWIYFDLHNLNKNDSYAEVIFPFKDNEQAKKLFDTFSLVRVDNGSLDSISSKPPIEENRLISTIKLLDRRQERNQIANLILPALDKALYADSLLENPESLKQCFVSTDQRIKYDKQLEIYLAEYRPDTIDVASKVRREKDNKHFQNLANQKISRVAPPVTLLLGPVGVGKSTYLKHFELVSGQEALSSQQTHWIYVDFKMMGKNPEPRKYMYDELMSYINYVATNSSRFHNADNLVDLAYSEKKNAVSRGPLKSLYQNDKYTFDQRFSDEVIWNDYQKIEPYVDMILSHLSQVSLCVIVLDNVDLFEDDELETSVFAAGLSLSKRIKANVIISMRETTYSKHRNSSTINAYDVKNLWLNPPDLKAVISKRLTYAKRVIEGESSSITIRNVRINISDLGKFFDNVQRSLLENKPGHFIESMSDGNVRKGLKLITNFLESGHIQADKAVIVSVSGNQNRYLFPLHEIFKGAILHEKLHFKEENAECINVFDSRLGVGSLQLLRLMLLKELVQRAKQERTKETRVGDLAQIFSNFGVSEGQILRCLRDLQTHSAIRETSAEKISSDSVIVITRSGGYLVQELCEQFEYVEECMFDTAITIRKYWQDLYSLTNKIENEQDRFRKNKLRKTRIRLFAEYLQELENDFLKNLNESEYSYLFVMGRISEKIQYTSDVIIEKTKKD